MIRKYDYDSSLQRKVILINTFLTSLFAGLFLTDTINVLKSVFFYKPVFEIVILGFLLIHLLGTIVGRLLFKKISLSRVLYIITEIFFISLSAVYFVKSFVNISVDSFFLNLLISKENLLLSFFFFYPFVLGVKNAYFLKTMCGIYFDEKRGVIPFFFLIITGILAGMLFYSFDFFGLFNMKYYAFLLVLLLPSIFLVKLSFSPVPLNVKLSEVPEQSGSEDDTKVKKYREDIVFSYLNMSYLVIYFMIGMITAIKFYGDILNIKIFFIMVVMSSLAAGVLFSGFFKKHYWHIYAEMLYPFTFIFYFLTMFTMWRYLPFYYTILSFIPNAFIFGITLNNSINFILSKYEHSKSYSIIGFSFFFMPVPLIAAIFVAPFSNRWFFVFFYVIALLNLILPGVHLMQKHGMSVKKGIYFALFCLIVPGYIVLHRFFQIPLDNQPYISYVKGYTKVYNMSSNADYLTEMGNIYFNNRRVFHVSDHSIRNLRRAVLSLSLFSSDEKAEVLFIDGYRRFFDNNVYNIFPNAVTLNYIDESLVDYNNLPVLGRKSAITYNEDIVSFLKNKNETFKIICDMPNLFDQRYNLFRFSDEYVKLIKRRMKPSSIYALVIQPQYTRTYYTNSAVDTFKKNFKKTMAFYFGESLVLYGSDDSSLLTIDTHKINQFEVAESKDKSYQTLFYSVMHCLGSVMFSDLNGINTEFMRFNKKIKSPFAIRQVPAVINTSSYSDYLSEHSKFLMLMDPEKTDYQLYKQKIEAEAPVLSLVKKAELSETEFEFENEAVNLSALKKMGDSNLDLRKYIDGIIENKQHTYESIANQYEDNKNWAKAREVYTALLYINENNFKANYKMALISMNLQDIDKAFVYLNKAMVVDPGNSEVIRLMGILLYTKGDYQKALEYLNNPASLKEDKAVTYLYMALCYEELGKLEDAKNYYGIALKKDPENKDIKALLDRLIKKMTAEKKIVNPEGDQLSHMDEEKGETLPLPVNKGAIDKRIPDEEVAKYQLFKKDENYWLKNKDQPVEEKKSFFDLFRGKQPQPEGEEPINKEEMYLQERSPIE